MMNAFRKTLSIAVVLLFYTGKAIAQNHTNMWLRATISIPLSGKSKTDAEFQHRRQNDFCSNNLLDKNLIFAFRSWAYYKHSKNVTFSLSPFAYFSNYKLIQKVSDADASATTEYRFTAATEWQNELTKHFFIVNRTAIEYRMFEGTVANTTRLRNKLGFRYDVHSKYSWNVGDEVLINTTGTDTNPMFDQNRLFTTISYKVNPEIKVDLGYMHLSRITKNGTELLNENNVILNVTYLFSQKHHS